MKLNKMYKEALYFFNNCMQIDKYLNEIFK